MDHGAASYLLQLVRDQIEEDGADSTAYLRQIANGECVVILETAVCQWFLWSHLDWRNWRKRTKKEAKEQRMAVVKAKKLEKTKVKV